MHRNTRPRDRRRERGFAVMQTLIKRDLTVEQIAAGAGVSVPTVRSMLSGRHAPSSAVLQAVEGFAARCRGGGTAG